MTKKEAYEIVYDDLSQIPLFMGCYDAEHSKDANFIFGISVVMKEIALRAGVEEGFDKEFSANFTNSNMKAYKKRLDYEKIRSIFQNEQEGEERVQ